LPRRASLSSASAEFLPFLLSKHLLISLTNWKKWWCKSKKMNSNEVFTSIRNDNERRW
jgi:hypothetical protein